MFGLSIFKLLVGSVNALCESLSILCAEKLPRQLASYGYATWTNHLDMRCEKVQNFEQLSVYAATTFTLRFKNIKTLMYNIHIQRSSTCLLVNK